MTSTLQEQLDAATGVIASLRTQMRITAKLLRDTTAVLHVRSGHAGHPEDCTEEACPQIREVVAVVLGEEAPA